MTKMSSAKWHFVDFAVLILGNKIPLSLGKCENETTHTPFSSLHEIPVRIALS